jgi:hypothetical protein
VLVLASAAAGIITTSRFDPVRGRLQDLFETTPDESFSDVCDQYPRLIAIDRERHKDNLLLEASHAVAAEGHMVDFQFDLVSRFQ